MKTHALMQLSLFISAVSITSVRGLTCLQCENILHPRHCHTVVQCEANETCRGDGVHNGTSCNDCCSSDLCNAQGCRESGYPLVRGPVCYDCSYHDEQHPCTNIDVCSVDEECSIISKDEFGDTVLTSGCRSRHICHSSSVQPSTIVGRRSVQDERSISQILCNKCCSHDLCNLNCSTDHCSSSPCQHGSCSSDGFSYKCHCLVGWSGLQCEQRINHCASSPCFNGSCVNEMDGFHCDCNNRSYGRLCEKSIADIEFSFDTTDCKNIGDSLTLRAKYTGSGSVVTVNWYYSDQSSGNNVVVPSRCSIFGTPDSGFPNNRLSYTCDTSTNTYTAKLSSLEQSDDGKEWGVTFSMLGQTTPDIVKKTLHICGLKYVYQLLQHTVSELRLDLEDANGTTAYEVYQNFSLSSSPSYRLHIGSFSGTAGDSGHGLSYNNGSIFSTFDRENNDHCPSVDHGGWWYVLCAWANLNGNYTTPGTISSYNSGEGGMTYYAWREEQSLNASEMKLRRK